MENGIASVPTASRILSGIDEELFALTFIEWIGTIVNTRGTHLAIDGKALRAAMNTGTAEPACHKRKCSHNRCDRDTDRDHETDR